jgi:uncharacterized damage-inducible protein DinB
MSQRDAKSLTAGNVMFLRQGLELLRRISDEDFAAPSARHGRGGVGAHVRHVLDHYDCFLRGIGAGHVDYDQRERDPQVETLRARALERVETLVRALERLVHLDASRPLLVTVDCGEAGERATSPSSVARELQFLVSHTVHHYAVIAGVLRARGVEPGADFGVAPSTLKYERGRAVCAR